MDYFLIFLGVAFSIFLTQISGPRPMPKPETPPWVAETIFPILPALLGLPQGVVLFWPLFYCIQRLVGRPQALTAAEWLWGVAWLGTVLLVVWAFWMRFGEAPAFAEKLAYPPQAIWTIIVVPTLAGLAFLIGLISLFGRWKQPWTHTFGIVLMIWPVIPLAALLLWSQSHWEWLPFVKK
jgi:hypothetical protein